MKYRKYISVTCLITLLLVIVSFNTYAQFTPPDEPCPPEGDPSCGVPLDTWVWVLMAAALAFVTVQLYRKQKAEQATIAG